MIKSVDSYWSCLACMFQILPMVPRLLQELHKDYSPESQHYFIRTVELLHSLMQLHAGFPDLYDPILEAVKVHADIDLLISGVAQSIVCLIVTWMVRV